jgi:UPF0755 protein
MNKKKAAYIAIGAAIVIIGFFCAILFTSFSTKDSETFVNVDPDDNLDSVYMKLQHGCSPRQMMGYKLLANLSGYGRHLRTGHFKAGPAISSFTLLRHMRNGMQTPVELTIPNVRTNDNLARELSKKIMLPKDSIIQFLRDSQRCAQYGFDTATIMCVFIPNTYEIYWNTSLDKLMKRMKKEYDAFWTPERTAKAKAAGLTPNEVITLASIVDEETANDKEKPMIAGMYLNRFHKGMPLQADPTIKFATRQFALHRIYENMLFIKSPYNTYRNIGLPPGPIRIPSQAGINAVLNYTKHDYMYMCAKEDFSGTHNFARTYAEHLANAKKYTQALNSRGIQ